MMQRQEARGSRQELALAPVRAALLRDASAEAERLLASARGAADALLEQARRDAVSKISHAREQGRMQAAQLARAELSRGRREARAIELGAQLHARADVERRIRTAIMGLKDEPGYGELRARLAGLALQAAGPGAAVSEHPEGGVVARGPGALVDCSLPRLAQRAIAVLDSRIRELGGG
jgi:vacuolar-type H+-ATPase subunit E/Vma4